MPETDEVKELREEVARLRTQIEQSKPTVVQPWWRKFFRKTHPMATNLFEYRLGVGYVVFGLLTFVSGLWMQGIYAQGSSNIGLQSILDTARTFPVSWWFLEILYILLAGVGIVLTLFLALLWRRFLVSSMILALVGIAPNIVSILSNIVLLSIVTTAQTYGSDSAFIVVSNAMYTLIGYAWPTSFC